MFIEDALAAATSEWTDPVVVRTYASDEIGRALLPLEAKVLAAYGYQPATQAAEGGHLNVGRLLATGGWSVLFSASRTPGSATLTYSRTSPGPLWEVDLSQIGDSLSLIPTYQHGSPANVTQIQRTAAFWSGQLRVQVRSFAGDRSVKAAEVELSVFSAPDERIYQQLRFADREIGELRFFATPGPSLIDRTVYVEQFGWSGYRDTNVSVPRIEGFGLSTVTIRRVQNRDESWTSGTGVDVDELLALLRQRVGGRGAAATKICPMCAEEVRVAAVICRFCRHEFGSSELSANP